MYCDLQKRQKEYELTAQPFQHVDKKQKTQGVFRLIFSDGKCKDYSVKELKEIDFFKGIFGRFIESDKQQVKLKNIRSDVFEVVTGLTLRHQHISELISKEDDLRYHPDLYEILEDTLEYFNPGKNEELLKDLKEHQLKHLNYEEAELILSNYEKSDDMPVWVKIAKLISLNKIYFETEEEVQQWTEKKKRMDKEFWVVNQSLKHHKNALSKNDTSKMEKCIELSKMHALNYFKTKLEKQSAFWHLTESGIPLMCHQRASQYINSDDSEIKKIAAASKKIIEDYKKSIMEALKTCGAIMDRQDLLEHLIGPKNFLFNEYGLMLAKGNVQYPFRHPLIQQIRSRFGYSLDNLSPYELETEIRQDLETYIPHLLPPRIIKSDETTRPITEEVHKLREFFMEKLHHWHTLEDDKKSEVIQKLIELSGWDKVNIKTEDVSITELKFQQSNEVTGKLEVRGNGVEFFFNTFDFIVCFYIREGVRSNQNGTLRALSTLDQPEGIENVIQYLITRGYLHPPIDENED